MTLRDYPTGADVTYTYDDPSVAYSRGRLTQTTDVSGISAFEYDILGRTTSRAQTIDGVWYTARNAFDAAGRLSTVTYPDGAIAAYQYDADAALCKVSSSATDTGCTLTAASYATFAGYNALGQVATVSFGNVTTTQYAYYDTTSNRLRTITTSGPAGALLSLAYSYDNVGNVKGITDGVNAAYTQSFGYDELNRLTSATSGAYGSLSYTYSPIGNILTKEGVSYYPYDPIKVHAVLATSDGKTFSYDANGNMIAETGSTARTLTYDYDNRPVAITSGGKTTYLTYDSSGQRVKKQGPSGTATIYVGKLYECKGNACTRHVFAGDQRVASVAAKSTSYYHTDHLGSTRVVTDKSGAVVESIFYRPFGAAQADNVPAASKHKFTGQEYDPETGLYFYNARYYNPSLGRFVSADTIVRNVFQPQDLNRYSYVANNPINRIDPSGHAWFGLSIFQFLAEAICGASVVCGVAVATVAVVASAVAVVKAAGGQTPLDRIDLNKLGNWTKTNWQIAGDQIKRGADTVAGWFRGGGAPPAAQPSQGATGAAPPAQTDGRTADSPLAVLAPRGGGVIVTAEAGAGVVWGADAQASAGFGVLADQHYTSWTPVAFAEGGAFAGGPNSGVGLPKPDYSDYAFNAVVGGYAGAGGGIWISNATGPSTIDKQFQAVTFNLGTGVLGGVSVGFAFSFPYYVFTLTYSPSLLSVGASFSSYSTWTEAGSLSRSP